MRIGINCGHTLTGPGSGAVGIISESEHTRKVGRALTQLLDDNGYTVIDCTVDKAATQDAYLEKTVEIANANNLDLFVSIHFNSFNGAANGTEVFTYGGKQLTEAVRTLNNIVAYGFTNRGIKDGSTLKVVRKTTAPAMLVEVCFCDNQADVDKYNSIGYMNIARAIFRGITGKDVNTVDTGIFTDVPTTDAAYEDIKNLKDYGIINGYSDGTFRPDAPITRREMAIIINRLFAYID